MTTVMIGIDPHKRSHTATAIAPNETDLAAVTVSASCRQLEELHRWAQQFPDRAWAIEAANGLGYLLSRQLVRAGETVIDVPPTLASRVRVLSTSQFNKNDTNDAHSIGVAALRHPSLAPVRLDNDTAVLKLLAKRGVDLAQARPRTVCRLHALFQDLVPGGARRNLSLSSANALLDDYVPSDAVSRTRLELCRVHLEEPRRTQDQQRALRRQTGQIVTASGTGLTHIYGIGPIVAAMIIGHTGDIARFANPDRFAAYNGTAPIELSSGGRRQLNHAIHIAAFVQIRNSDTEGRQFYDRKRTTGKTHGEALRALKRHVSDRVYRQLVIDATRR